MKTVVKMWTTMVRTTAMDNKDEDDNYEVSGEDVDNEDMTIIKQDIYHIIKTFTHDLQQFF